MRGAREEYPLTERWLREIGQAEERRQDIRLEHAHPGARPARIEELGSWNHSPLYTRANPTQVMEVGAWL